MGIYITDKLTTHPIAPTQVNDVFFYPLGSKYYFMGNDGIPHPFSLDQEAIEDIIGALILASGNGTVVTYNDAGNSLKIDINPTTLALINSALQAGDDISLLNNNSGFLNPATHNALTHNLTPAEVGLSNVTNVDATARANHTGTQLASTISDFNSSAINAVGIAKDVQTKAVAVGVQVVFTASFAGDIHSCSIKDGNGQSPIIEQILTGNQLKIKSNIAFTATVTMIGGL